MWRILFLVLFYSVGTLRRRGAFYAARDGFWYFHNSTRVRLLGRILEDPEGGRAQDQPNVSELRSYLRADKAERFNQIEQLRTVARDVHGLCTD